MSDTPIFDALASQRSYNDLIAKRTIAPGFFIERNQPVSGPDQYLDGPLLQPVVHSITEPIKAPESPYEPPYTGIVGQMHSDLSEALQKGVYPLKARRLDNETIMVKSGELVESLSEAMEIDQGTIAPEWLQRASERLQEDFIRSPFERARLNFFAGLKPDPKIVRDKVKAWSSVAEEESQAEFSEQFGKFVSDTYQSILRENPGAIITGVDVHENEDGSAAYVVEGFAPVDPTVKQKYIPVPHRTVVMWPGEFLSGGVVWKDTSYLGEPATGFTGHLRDDKVVEAVILASPKFWSMTDEE